MPRGFSVAAQEWHHTRDDVARPGNSVILRSAVRGSKTLGCSRNRIFSVAGHDGRIFLLQASAVTLLGMSDSDGDDEIDLEAELEEEQKDGGAPSADGGEPSPELYDAAADDKDEAWVAAKRRGGASDASLACPCCLALLCSDCQQHTLYATQFRAMFVSENCVVDKWAPLRMGEQKEMARRRGSTSAATNGGGDGELFWPVHCAACNTQARVRGFASCV